MCILQEELMLGLWKTEKGNYISHNKGLTEEQVTYFQNLKVGDRLVVFVNDIRKGEKSPELTLKRSSISALQTSEG